MTDEQQILKFVQDLAAQQESTDYLIVSNKHANQIRHMMLDRQTRKH